MNDKSEPNRKSTFTDEELDRLLERMRPRSQQPVDPELAQTYSDVAREILSGTYTIKPDSPLFGLKVFTDIMDIHASENMPDEDLRRLVYRAEDVHGLNLELIQEQLAHQIDLSWEPGRYGIFPDGPSLDRAMEEGLRLGFFKRPQGEVGGPNLEGNRPRGRGKEL